MLYKHYIYNKMKFIFYITIVTYLTNPLFYLNISKSPISMCNGKIIWYNNSHDKNYNAQDYRLTQASLSNHDYSKNEYYEIEIVISHYIPYQSCVFLVLWEIIHCTLKVSNDISLCDWLIDWLIDFIYYTVEGYQKS